MSDLFLRIRVQSLHRTLEQVAALTTAVKASNDDIQSVYRALALAGSDFRIKLLRLIDFVDTLHRTAKREDSLRDLLKTLEKLDDLTEAHEHAESLDAELGEMTAMMQDLKDGIDEIESLLVGTADVFPNVDKMSNDLHTLEESLPTPETAAASSDDWAQLGVIVAEARSSVFGYYVEVAGGLSMRKTGLDDRVCVIADRLCRLWQVKTGDRFVTPAFSLPGRDESRPGSTVVSLGFPEWTIWGLPLLEHDIGLLALTADPDPLEGVEATLAADAFGTFVMGPAYACAALLLRLDPAQAADRQRADVVLAALSRLESTTFQGALASVISTLTDAWTKATASLAAGVETGQPAPTGASASAASAAATSVALERAAELIKESTRTDEKYPMQISKDEFSTATTLKNALLGTPPAIPAELALINERAALNGAWLARLDNQHVDRARTIEERIKHHLAPRALRRQAKRDAPAKKVAIPTGFNTARGGLT